MLIFFFIFLDKSLLKELRYQIEIFWFRFLCVPKRNLYHPRRYSNPRPEVHRAIHCISDNWNLDFLRKGPERYALRYSDLH